MPHALDTIMKYTSMSAGAYVLLWAWFQTFNHNPSSGFFRIWWRLCLYYFAYSIPIWLLLLALAVGYYDFSMILALFIAGLLLIYGYFCLYIPNQLQLRQHTINLNLTQDKTTAGFKLGVISDIKMGLFSGKPRHIRQLVQQINQLNVDAFCILGDWLYYPSADLVGQLLSLKSVNKPVYVIQGSHDLQYIPPNAGQSLLEDSLDKAFTALGLIQVTAPMTISNHHLLIANATDVNDVTNIQPMPESSEAKAQVILLSSVAQYQQIQRSYGSHLAKTDNSALTTLFIAPASLTLSQSDLDNVTIITGSQITGSQAGTMHYFHSVGVGICGLPLRWRTKPTIDILNLI
ncbi:metallophosphoesterase [Psychrobacter sp. I-STPA6b]|uniref:metallophosphoesterase n=1 Tax=Psychrobacter sp. I-STPA6b TaxID=2585718 RepID=UPI001D0CB4D7|nr:metallophosphoesterase [Psychrobacter sp. I-STPA6b]